MSWGIGDRVGVAVGLSNIATFKSRNNSLVPSLNFNFAETGTLDSRITFTRSTTGTYYNSSGILVTAAINAPRFTYDPTTLLALGLLVEESKTNTILYSQDLTNVVWSNGGGVAIVPTGDTAVAPDGTTTADTLADGTGTGTRFIAQTNTVVSGTSYVMSAYFKANTATAVQLTGGGATFGPNAWVTYNLANGTVGASGSAVTDSSIKVLPNGWYRVTMTAPAIASILGNTFIIVMVNSPTATRLPSYTGTNSSLYIWGTQLDVGSVSSYIPTTLLQVTRAADIPSLPIDTWYSTSKGTWFAQVNMISTSGTPRIVGATPSSKAPIQISSQAAAMNDNSTTISTVNTITANATQKIATSWTSTTGQVCLNAGTVATGSQPNGYANLTTIGIGYNSTLSNNFINGTIAKISYYPQVLTSTQLQALTGS